MIFHSFDFSKLFQGNPGTDRQCAGQGPAVGVDLFSKELEWCRNEEFRSYCVIFFLFLFTEFIILIRLSPSNSLILPSFLPYFIL